MAVEPTFTWVNRTVDDSKILTEVYVPSFSTKGPELHARIPLIYIIHGGGWVMGHPRMNPKVQIEAARGLEYPNCHLGSQPVLQGLKESSDIRGPLSQEAQRETESAAIGSHFYRFEPVQGPYEANCDTKSCQMIRQWIDYLNFNSGVFLLLGSRTGNVSGMNSLHSSNLILKFTELINGMPVEAKWGWFEDDLNICQGLS